MRQSPWKVTAYALIVLFGVLAALPNLLTREQLALLPDWLPKQQVTLGLDLRGGSQLLLEIDGDAVRSDRLSSLSDSAAAALQGAGIRHSGVRVADNAVTVRPLDAAQGRDALRVLTGLNTPVETRFGTSGPPSLEVNAGTDGTITLRPTEADLTARLNAAADHSLEIVRRRIDQAGIAEPTVMRQGASRILVQLPGVQDPTRIKELLGSTARLSFHMVDETAGDGRVPGTTLLPLEGSSGQIRIRSRVMLEGDRLVDATAGFDQRSGQPIVQFRFDSQGAKRFADITQKNVGKPFAIVLDGRVLSAPVIQEPILGGSGQISGHFTTESAKDLAVLLRAGALPAPMKVIEERTVGADLGADAIEQGVTTGLIGFALVFIFMVVLYGRWGLVANLALASNVVLTFAALSLLGATLTLPGIAGIILGVGLAVDANVLINERIREETARGRSAIAALDAGFKRAYSTIVDSNVTTLIATTMLFALGSGPVRGFAITMGLGIMISMFTAVSIVRMIMALWVVWRRPRQFIIRPLLGMRLIPDNTAFRFMRGRFIGIAVSAVLSVSSLALFVHPGLNYGIDFVGGTLVEVKTQEPARLDELRRALNGLDLGEVALQEAGSPNNVLVRIERQPGDDQAQAAATDKVKAKLAEIAPGSAIERVEVVGPKVSGELMEAGVLAVALACLAMLIYIWVRFEWQFAVGAIVTLVLDVTKAVGLFAITGLDFNLTAIAALLTLIGYSVNDKVVVYDRMRENLRLYKKMPLRELIDLSINATLARSIYTSATAFLSMLPMALAGGSAVDNFAIPMVFGIVVGASSSVFIAAPILLFLGEGRLRRGGRLPAPVPAASAG
ncbi:protein translocase subunit SecD [Vineibacter terrae]|uniref:Multifunctional fusion protein n=1 Tax=Vineibacter terrae TaxID=2586908 RepID=A0A5C8PS89_9HYPH|nr:protein translocase subunit SecD [Vineibacter terrae]TXL79524.1 protein translocase subunit SecD [Vineibacter terrae]